jgi:hypothetical protein
VRYHLLGPMLLAEIQRQEKVIAEQGAELEALRRRFDRLDRRPARLRAGRR